MLHENPIKKCFIPEITWRFTWKFTVWPKSGAELSFYGAFGCHIVINDKKVYESSNKTRKYKG